MSDRPTVAIIGGGASGSLLATQLTRRLHPDGLRVVLIERRAEPGRGLAYSTPWDFHRLNVPVEQMGAFPRDAAHFLRWAQRTVPEAAPGDFMPRGLYGDYLTGILRDATTTARPGVELECIHDEAIGAEVECDGPRPTVVVEMKSTPPVRADRLVLAFGNLPPALLPGADASLAESDRYHGDPWDPALPGLAAGEDSILLIGTGLTMVDIALVLGAEGGPRRIHAISRNGLLPRAHSADGVRPEGFFELPSGSFTLDELIAEVDRQITETEAAGGDWRQVIDSLRPVTNRIWGRLPAADRERFVHDVSRHWEVRRHRMAPEVASMLDRLERSGKLRVRGADIQGLHPVDCGIEVSLGERDGAPAETFTVDRVVNCTGPSLRVGIAGEPVLASLLDAGQVRPGPFNLGLDHDSRGAMITVEGTPSPVIFGIGPVRKGRLWETTAIPEIRTQAFELADLLTSQLTSRSAQSGRLTPLDV